MSILSFITLIAISGAAMSYQWVYSDLKRLLFLDKQYPVLMLLASPKAYRRLIGGWFYPLLLLILPVVIIASIHGYLYKLFSCIYCSAFWFGLGLALLFHFTIMQSILVGGITVFAQNLNHFIKSRSI